MEDTTVRAETHNDSLGWFMLAKPPNGTYVVNTKAIGFATRRDTIRVPGIADSILAVPVVLQPMDGPCGGIAKVFMRTKRWRWPWQ